MTWLLIASTVLVVLLQVTSTLYLRRRLVDFVDFVNFGTQPEVPRLSRRDEIRVDTSQAQKSIDALQNKAKATRDAVEELKRTLEDAAKVQVPGGPKLRPVVTPVPVMDAGRDCVNVRALKRCSYPEKGVALNEGGYYVMRRDLASFLAERLDAEIMED